MVFTCVQIWRGIVITKEKLIELIRDVNQDYKFDDETCVPEIIDDFIKMGIELPEGICMRKYGPCHGDDHILIGIKLKEYKRTPFDRNYLTHNKDFEPKYGWGDEKCCGKNICDFGDTKEESKSSVHKSICGEYVVCNYCLNSTINGNYDVVTISSEVTECTTFCFGCNKDKCNGKKCDSTLMNTKKFVDGYIESFTDCLGLEPNVKCYYTVDDCLSCS